MKNKLTKVGMLLATAALLTSCKSNCLKMDPLDISYGLPSNIQGTFSVSNKCLKNKDGNPTPVVGLERENYKTLGAYEISLMKNERPPKEILSQLEAAKVVYMTPKSYELNVTLLLDLSGSISKSDKELENLKNAAIDFVQTATNANGREIKIGIYTFDGRADLIPLVHHTNQKDKIIERISGISCSESSINDYCVDPSTNLNGAIIEGAKISSQIARQSKKELSSHTLIVFTDGTDQADRESHFTAKSQVEKVMIANGHRVMTVGVGTEINKRKLKELGPSGNFFTSQKNELRNVFINVAEEIRNQASSVYTIRYCTAKRSRTQDISFGVRSGNDYGYLTGMTYDANGFTAGCNISDESQWTNEALPRVPDLDKYEFKRSVSKYAQEDSDLLNWYHTFKRQKEHRLELQRLDREQRELSLQRQREEQRQQVIRGRILTDIDFEIQQLSTNINQAKHRYLHSQRAHLNYLKNQLSSYEDAKGAIF